MSVKALGIALKLTVEGTNQLVYSQTWVFAVVVISCILMQMNYLNKVKVFKEMHKCFIFKSRLGQKLLILVCLFTGSGHLQYSCSLANLLCDVHIIDYTGECDYVQGVYSEITL